MLEQDLAGFDLEPLAAGSLSPLSGTSSRSPARSRSGGSIVPPDMWEPAMVLARENKIVVRKMRLQYTGVSANITFSPRRSPPCAASLHHLSPNKDLALGPLLVPIVSVDMPLWGCVFHIAVQE